MQEIPLMATTLWLKQLRSTRTRRQTARSRRQTPPHARPRVDVLEDRTLPSAYIVTTTADTGPGSLRDAINQINADTNHTLYTSPSNSNVDEIDFNITAASDTGGGFNAGTGVATITPLSALPQITNAVLIDGYTQAGASPNTLGIGPGSTGHALGDGSNAILKVELNGSSAGNTADGLAITGPASTLRGLVINRFGGDAIGIGGSGGNTIAGNFIGTDPSGTIAEGNDASLQSPYFAAIGIGSSNNLIGGLNPASRNLISGNDASGIGPGGANNIIQGNLIGTNAAGTGALGNASEGIGTTYGPGPGTLIGGTTPDARNIISGTTGTHYIGENGAPGNGVYMNQAGEGTRIEGNFIGTDVSGTQALGNRNSGVSAGFTFAPDVFIGGTDPGAGNLLSGNYGYDFTGNGSYTAQGNMIDTDYTGTSILGGGGVFLLGSGGEGCSGAGRPEAAIWIWDPAGSHVPAIRSKAMTCAGECIFIRTPQAPSLAPMATGSTTPPRGIESPAATELAGLCFSAAQATTSSRATRSSAPSYWHMARATT
jgi:hypothetical protein